MCTAYSMKLLPHHKVLPHWELECFHWEALMVVHWEALMARPRGFVTAWPMARPKGFVTAWPMARPKRTGLAVVPARLVSLE